MFARGETWLGHEDDFVSLLELVTPSQESEKVWSDFLLSA